MLANLHLTTTRYLPYLLLMTNDVATLAIAKAPLKDLAAWAAATEKEIAEIRAQMLPLEERIASAKERLDLIRRLIGLADAANGTPSDAGQVHGPTIPHSISVEAQLEAILSEAGQPLHIAALREGLIERGVPLPGKGDEANIIVRLRRDENRFTRTGRGMYALAAWGMAAVAPTRKKKVRRRKAANR